MSILGEIPFDYNMMAWSDPGSKRLGISQPTASQSVKRGEKIVKEKNLKLKG